MLITYPTNHHLHNQTKEIFHGVVSTANEVSSRIDNIKKAMLQAYPNIRIIEDLYDFDDEIILSTHSKSYIDYLVSREKIINKGEEVFGNDFGYVGGEYSEPISENAKIGYYVSDTYTAFTKDIWLVARQSYQAVHTAGLKVLEGEKIAYALTRPPGHHATRSKAVGYCYLSNASIFANFLRNKGIKVGILDIDVHHGNGAQSIFYDDDEVITVSLHADPIRKFPYFTGFANEVGTGKGLNKNLNIPLSEGMGNNEYIENLEKALNFLKKEDIEFLIVGLGFDTYEKDPLGDLKITIEGYQRIGEIISQFNKKTLFIQEGGYNLEDIGKCAVSFFSKIV